MEAGQTKIVTDIYELKDLIPKGKRIGHWCIGYDLHEGHLECYKIIRTKVDFLPGVYLNNFYQVIQYVTGFDPQARLQFSLSSLIGMAERCEIVHLGCHDHLPYARHTPDCINERQLPTESLPEYIRHDPRSLALLRTAQSINRLVWELTGYDFHIGSVKDYWRPYAAAWARKHLGMEYMVIDPLRDEYGNSVSSSYGKWQDRTKQKIDFQLLTQETLTKEDFIANLNKHHIKNLHILDFNYDTEIGYVFTRMTGEGLFWSECLNTN